MNDRQSTFEERHGISREELRRRVSARQRELAKRDRRLARLRELADEVAGDGRSLVDALADTTPPERR